MKGLFLKRGRGKTTALVYTSALTGYPMIVATEANKRHAKEVASRMGVSIPEPITLSQDTRGMKLNGVLIDNAEAVIRAYAEEHFNAPVVAYSMTLDEEA